MIRPSSPRAFTLIEMLVVMAIIAILAGLVLSIQGLAQTKAARAKAETEIRALTGGAEAYKGDNGTYPRNTDTDSLDPRKDGTPSGSGSEGYQKASLYLYTSLSGDFKPEGAPDGKPEAENKVYLAEFFKPGVLGGKKDSDGKLLQVKYLQDPFGNSYGYSTKGAKSEEEFQQLVRTSSKPEDMKRPGAAGFNPTFDLWSTGGSTKGATSAEQAKWIKNW